VSLLRKFRSLCRRSWLPIFNDSKMKTGKTILQAKLFILLVLIVASSFAELLKSYHVDGMVSVSGFSAGAFFAVQVRIKTI
jgi:hypothetical protein